MLVGARNSLQLYPSLILLLSVALEYSSRLVEPAIVRNKRDLVDDDLASSGARRRQPQQSAQSATSIPAAYPGFEAAFQGECGDASDRHGPGAGNRQAAANGTGGGNPCEHICLDLHDGTYECSCFYGFTLAVDGYSCSPLVSASTQRSVTKDPPTSPKPTTTAAATTTTTTITTQEALNSVAGYRHETVIGLGRDSAQSARVTQSRAVAAGERPSYPFRKSYTWPIKLAAERPEEANVANKEEGDGGDSNNKDDIDSQGTAKRLSYQLDQDQLSSEINLDVDSDIRSVMVQNDHLVRDLIQSLSDWAREEGSRSDELGKPESVHGLSGLMSAMKKNNSYSKRAADYELLVNLIQKTAEPIDGRSGADLLTNVHSSRRRTLVDELDISSRAAPSEQFRPAVGPWTELNPISGPRYGLDLEELKQRPLDNSGPIRSALEQKAARLPEWANNPLACGIIDDKLPYLEPHFEDCSDLPECESGGRCVIEQLVKESPLQSLRQPSIEGRSWLGARQEIIAHQGALQEYHPKGVQRIARCGCPVGRAGQLCQKPLQRSVPQFIGHSYLALPATSAHELDDLRLVFKPRLPLAGPREQPALLLLQGRKFLLLLDSMNRIELRYFSRDNPRQVIRVIGSRDAELNKWNELWVTDASRDNNGLADKWTWGVNRIVLVTPDKVQLFDSTPAQRSPTTRHSESSEAEDRKFTSWNNSTELFVAGKPESLRRGVHDVGGGDSQTRYADGAILASTLGEEATVGFTGCIKELTINQRSYNFRSDLNGDTLDGFDIGECCD